MFNKNDTDFKKLFEIVNDPKNTHTTPNNHGKRDWSLIQRKANDTFESFLTARQWEKQYRSGIERNKKFGNPGVIRVELTSAVQENKKTEIEKKEIEKKEFEDIKNKIKNLLIKERTIEYIKIILNLEMVEILGHIQLLRLDGYSINYNEQNETYVIDKKPVFNSKLYTHSIGEKKEFEFVVVSCSHWGSKKQQKSFVNYIYDEAEKRGIRDVYHCGDIVDGYYKNREEQIYELISGKIGADDQVDYVVNNWPYKPGITTHLLLGNHDETHIRNGGINIGRAIVRGRNDIGYKDFNYLGIGYAPIQLTPNCRMDLLHPLDGSSYAISYSGQKYMDSISGGDKPNILFVGHHHKALYFPYRNIHYFEVPSMMAQSSWMKRKRIANESGAWFVKLTIDEEGTIVRIIPEHIKQYKFLENDF